MVGHLQYAANVRRLALVEEEIGGRRVVILAVAALEKFQRYQRIQEITCGSRVQAEPALQSFQRSSGVLGQFREKPHFHCAQQHF